MSRINFANLFAGCSYTAVDKHLNIKFYWEKAMEKHAEFVSPTSLLVAVERLLSTIGKKFNRDKWIK